MEFVEKFLEDFFGDFSRLSLDVFFDGFITKICKKKIQGRNQWKDGNLRSFLKMQIVCEEISLVELQDEHWKESYNIKTFKSIKSKTLGKYIFQ